MILERITEPGSFTQIKFWLTGNPVDGGVIVLPDIFGWETRLDRIIWSDRESTSVPGWDATKKSMAVFGMIAVMAYLHGQGRKRLGMDLESFGLNAEMEIIVPHYRLWNVDTLDDRMHSSHFYAAPEAIADDDYDRISAKTDVYAFGSSLYLIFAPSRSILLDQDREPVRSDFAFLHRISLGAKIARAPDIPETYWRWMESCWRTDPDARPSSRELLDGWLRNRQDYVFPGSDHEKVIEYERKVMASLFPDWQTQPAPRV